MLLIGDIERTPENYIYIYILIYIYSYISLFICIHIYYILILKMITKNYILFPSWYMVFRLRIPMFAKCKSLQPNKLLLFSTGIHKLGL